MFMTFQEKYLPCYFLLTDKFEFMFIFLFYGNIYIFMLIFFLIYILIKR